MSEEFAQASTDVSANAYQQPQEKMLNQEQVNALVGREKAAAADKARREADDRYRIELERLKESSQPYFDKDSLIQEAKKAAKDEMIHELNDHKRQRDLKEYEAQQGVYAQQYVSHVKNVEVPAEEDECGLFSDPMAYKDLVLLAGELNFDNTGEIMKELARNPGKLNQADSSALKYESAKTVEERNKAKTLLKAQFRRISDSIKKNKDALDNSPKVNAPLSQIKPSSTGSRVDYAKMSLSDLKKQRWLQG